MRNLGTYDELLGAIKQLTPEKRIALIRASLEMVEEDILHSSKQSKSLKPIEELVGSLNPEGRVYTDEALDELKYSYLAEKYS